MQKEIQFKESVLSRQLSFLFPTSVSANQELLESLKREYADTRWMSEVEAILLQQQIQDEKDRPVQAIWTILIW